jgi:L-alanine-DL-glutamate epimerase-like enolase superfamily enzyme
MPQHRHQRPCHAGDSAVDIARWDLKARLLNIPLTRLFGATRGSAPIYGSGGFTNLEPDQLAAQVDRWRDAGCKAMKIKIGEAWGQHITRDLQRVQQLRDLTGDDVQLMVDANGGYSIGQAGRVGAALDVLGVVWFEEPVSSDDIEGLAIVRDALRCDVAAGRTRPTATMQPASRPSSIAYSSTSPAAAAIPAGAAAPRSPPRTTCKCRRTAPPHCTRR